MTASTATGSQTLDRGISMLEYVTDADAPPTIAAIAEHLGVHRSIAYRILRTFEGRGLLRRDDAGRVHPAPALAVLARRVEQDLQAAALPELSALSAELGMSAFVVVWDGGDCVTLVTVEPPRGNLVTQRPGTQHPLGRGGPGIALAAGLTEDELDDAIDSGAILDSRRRDVEQARRRGMALSSGEVIPGVSSVAVPLRVRGQLPASLAVVYATRAADTRAIGQRLRVAAGEIARVLGD
ncbi:MAG: IclR family transcriptional regulator [Micrococcus sp.]|nr:IclR family transcriptional regulator [Micrococcus sp.]